jgi:hypothetical protein
VSLVRVRTGLFCAALGLVSSVGIVSAAQEADQHQHPMPMPADLLGEPHDVGSKNTPVAAFTGGIVRDVLSWRGGEGAVGTDVTFYAVPASLRTTHGSHPVSFQIFFRLRPPAGQMGRMWNMRMVRPG